MAFNALFQVIPIVWGNIAKAMELEAMQHFGLQQQHVQITSNVAVFTTKHVMVLVGS